jgi:hypothetical protein
MRLSCARSALLSGVPLHIFVDIATSAPTVFFTVPLLLVAAYWLMVGLGAADIDALDLDMEPIEASGWAAWLAALKVGSVPVTVALSAFIFWGWISGFLLSWLITGLSPTVASSFAAGIGMMALAVVAAAGLTRVSVRPLGPLFATAPARARAELIGESCEITTGRVDAGFGQAQAQLGTDALVFQVRCDRIGNGLVRGGRALIVHFDERREAYIIEPMAADSPAPSAQSQRRSEPIPEG